MLLSTQQEVSIDGILAVDGDDKIILFNRRFAEMWNVPPKLIASKDDVPVLQWVRSLVVDADAFVEKVSYLYDHRHETSRDEIALIDGRVFDRYSAPMFGLNDQYYGRVWYFRDMTERKQMEDRDVTAIQRNWNRPTRPYMRPSLLPNAQPRQERVPGQHEPRNPHADDGHPRPCGPHVGRERRTRYTEHIAVIKRNGEHLMHVIGDILDLSKIEAEKLQIDPTRCSPVQLVAEVVSLMRPQAAAKQLKLKTELTGPLPETVLTDPLRLRQVLVNLVGNAIKFTDQGEIRLAARLTAESGPSRLRFDVIDTGIGMNEEQVGKLFQPFTQVDNSPTRKFGGTGLGLCISKHLAEALGGKIEVRSAPGKGSTFSVTIDPGPLDGMHMIQDAQEALLDRPPSATAATPEKIVLHGRILLAEDGPDNQRLICLLLRKAGADVTAVENGQLAVEAALAAREAGEPFDVILMDMQMSVMDGYTATRQLRKRGYTAPIVALTAHAMAHDCQKCLDAGCDDYAAKPIDRQKLLATVATWTAPRSNAITTRQIPRG